jgi:hypothetical protein
VNVPELTKHEEKLLDSQGITWIHPIEFVEYSHPTSILGQRVSWVLDAAAMRSRMTPGRVREFCDKHGAEFCKDYNHARAIMNFIREIEREVCGGKVDTD